MRRAVRLEVCSVRFLRQLLSALVMILSSRFSEMPRRIAISLRGLSST